MNSKTLLSSDKSRSTRGNTIIAVLVCGLVGILNAQDFEIKMARPSKVGDTYGVESKGSTEQHIAFTVDGEAAPPQNEMTSAVLKAKAEVLAVTALGKESKVRFTVASLSKIVDGKAEEVLPAGTVVIGVHRGKKTEFTVADGPAAPEIAKLLDVVIHLAPDNKQEVNDDVIFGTKERQKIGGTWPVNAVAASKDLALSQELKVAPENITGTVTLVEKTKDGLDIHATMELKKVDFPLPPGMTTKASKVKVQFGGVFPLDLTKRDVSQTMTMEGNVECTAKSNGKDLTMVLEMKSVNQVSYTVP